MATPTNPITPWRQAIVAYLDENLGGGTFTVVNAKRDGPSADRKLCCVFSDPTTRATSNPGAFLNPTLVVRAWLRKPLQPRPRGGRQPRTAEPDPGPLEDLEMDLWATLTATRELPTIEMFFEVMETVKDLDDWGVQANLVGWVQRPLP